MLQNKALLLLSVTGLFWHAPQAWSCGACYEDNRAAVYSHEAAQKAAGNPDKYEFVVIKVIGPLTPAHQEGLKTWLKARKGIDPATVAVSGMQQTIGFLFEKEAGREKLMEDLTAAFPFNHFKILEYPAN